MLALSYNAVKFLSTTCNRNRLPNLLAIIFFGITYSLATSNPAHSQVIQVLEAEQAFIKNAKASPKGYVELNADNSKLGSIEWVFNVPSAGDYEIRFRYLVRQKEFSPLMKISTQEYDIAKKRFFETPGKTWQEEAWLIKAAANEQFIVRLGVNNRSLDKSKIERIYVDKLIIDQPSYLTTNVKVVPDQVPEFGQPGYENTYYGKVDPQGKRTTLKKWLRINGYTKKSNKNKIVRSQYINSFDLGFGRAMNCLDVDHLSCYVDNYINLDRDQRVTIKTKKPTFAATVAMERMRFLDPITQQSRLITAFFVYDKDGKNGDPRRIARAPLDNEGAKAVPESCYVCHKGNTDSNGNPVGGQFLPWDLHLLNENLRGSPAVDKQHDNIRKLNHMVWKDASQPDPSDPSKVRKESLKNLIEGWYGGEPLAGTTFNDKFIPNNWYSNPASANVQCSGVPTTKPCKEKFSYQDLYAVYCRTCHVTHGEGQDVGNQQLGKLWANAEEFRKDAHKEICTNPNTAKQMPNAELTFHRFNTDIDPQTGRTAKDILCDVIKENLKPSVTNIGIEPTLTIKEPFEAVSVDVNLKSNVKLGDGTLDQHTVALAPHPDDTNNKYGRLKPNPDGTYTYIIDDSNKVTNVKNTSVSEIYHYTITDLDGDTTVPSQLTFNISGAFAARPDNSSEFNCTDKNVDLPSCNVMANDAKGDKNGVSVNPINDKVGTNGYGTLKLYADGTYAYTVNNSNVLTKIKTITDAANNCNLIDEFNYRLVKGNETSDATITMKIGSPFYNLKANEIFNTQGSCIACHYEDVDPVSPTLNNLNRLKISEFVNNKSDVYNRVKGVNIMPPPVRPIGTYPDDYTKEPLDDNKKAIIKCWSK